MDSERGGRACIFDECALSRNGKIRKLADISGTGLLDSVHVQEKPVTGTARVPATFFENGLPRVYATPRFYRLRQNPRGHPRIAGDCCHALYIYEPQLSDRVYNLLRSVLCTCVF